MSREHSSVGRASALQAGGHRFEPYCSHQCGNGSVVERYLAKVNVASSNLVSRSIAKGIGFVPIPFAMERETREKPNSQSSAPEERSSEEVCRGIPPNGKKTTRRVKGGNGSISFPLNQAGMFYTCSFFMERETREKPNSQSSAPEERSSEEVCRGIPPNGNKTTRRVKGGNGSISFPLNQADRFYACSFFYGAGQRDEYAARLRAVARI